MIWEKRNYIVYKIKNLLTGMSYIGVTSCGLKKRIQTHRSQAKLGSTLPLHIDIVKYGIENFEVTELDYVKNASTPEASVMEFKYIQEYNTVIPNGYNKYGYKKIKLSEKYLSSINKVLGTNY